MDAEQDGDQHRRAEHGENMLDAQGNKLCRRDLFIYLNDALFCPWDTSPLKNTFREKYTTFSGRGPLFLFYFGFLSNTTETAGNSVSIPTLRRLTKYAGFL